MAPASFWSRANHGHWTQQDVVCVKPITSWVLHPCLLARRASETTYEAENQVGSLYWRCCHGLPPGAGALEQVCMAIHSLSACQPAPSPWPRKPRATHGQNPAWRLWGWCSPFPQDLPGRESYVVCGARPWQTNLPCAVLQILLAPGFGFSKKMRTGSTRRKPKCPKEGNWNILNKYAEKNVKTWGQMLEKSETHITYLGLDSAPISAGAQPHMSWSHTQPKPQAVMWPPQPSCIALFLGGVSPDTCQCTHVKQSV